MASKKDKKKPKKKKKQIRFIINYPIAIISGAALGIVLAYAFSYRFLHFVSLQYIIIFFLLNTIAGILLTLMGCFISRKLFAGKHDGLPSVLALLLSLTIPAVGFVLEWKFNFPKNIDIMLVVVDAARADYLSVYGYEKLTTPRLEEFAKDAVVFKRAIAQGAHTIQATPSILASVYPTIHGLQDYKKVLSEDIVLISEVLKRQKYKTMGIVANPHLTAINGFRQGYDYYKAVTDWSKPPADAINRDYFKWLRKNNPEKLFSFLFYIDPHTPYEPPQRFLDLFYQGPQIEIASYAQEDYEALDDNGRRNFEARYLAELRYFDDRLSKLFNEMKRLGTYNNTMIIFTSDHGEGFYDHKLVGHGNSLYNELIHVPLIIRFPDLVRYPRLNPRGKIVTPLVRQIDILPTVCDFLGYQIPKLAQGTSVLSIIYERKDDLPELDFILSEEIAHLPMMGRDVPYQMRSITTDQYKLIVNQSLDYREFQGELYDLINDPGETVNLYHRNKNLADSLGRILNMKLEEIIPLAMEAKPAQINREMIERLRALGYIK